MITHEFFIKYLGFSEEQAKACYNKIKNDKFSSVSGILRLNDDTLFQKFNYYKNELGMSAEKVMEDFRLLTYDTTSDETKTTSVQAKVKFFRDELGFSNKQIQSTMSIFSNSLESLKEKVNFLKTEIDFEPRHIGQVTTILNYDLETLKSKIKFYKDTLGFTSKQFREYPGIFTLDCDSPDKPNSAINKIKFYQEELGFDASQLRTFPCLLSFDTTSGEENPTSVRSKIKFYKDTLGYTNKQFQASPALFNHDIVSDETNPTSVQYKIKFLRENAGFTNKSFQTAPEVFGFDCSENEQNPTSIRAKMRFFAEEVGLSPEHFGQNPVLFHFDCISGEENPKSVRSKLAKLREIGITNEDIQANTKLLMTPAEDIKTKYALWSTIFPDKRFMELKTWFITRVEKIYARYQFLTQEKGMTELRPQHLDICESQFKIRFKSDSAILQQRYPFTPEVVDAIYASYAQMEIEPPIQKD